MTKNKESLARMGEKVEKETRHYSATTGATTLARKKESEEEYGYIYEPDLPVFKSKASAKDVEAEMPELPDQKLSRLKKEYKLTAELAEQLVVDKEMADAFEEVAKKVDVRLVATWFTSYLRKTLVYQKLRFRDTKLETGHLVELLDMIQKGEITDRGGELLLRKIVLQPGKPREMAKELKLIKLDEKELGKIIKDMLEKEERARDAYVAGDKKLLKYFIGRIISKSGARADPKQTKMLLKKELKVWDWNTPSET